MNLRQGFLLVQLGSPEALDLDKVGEYLYDFLGDPHTLGNPPFFWKPLLRYVIIPLSRKKSLGKYKKMFARHNFSEMPLVSVSFEFLEKLRKELPDTFIELGFQYGCAPKIEESLKRLVQSGVEEIKVVPLYPQRSGVTTGAVLDQVKQVLQKISYHGKVTFANGFSFHKAWAREVANELQEFDFSKNELVLSFHGVQKVRIEKGDPYEFDCQESAKLIGEFLGVKPIVAYQSKYGNGKWLTPSLIETLESLGRAKKNVVVASPAFVADNLETIYEIDDEVSEFFYKAGGKSLSRVSCLNAKDSWVKAFAHEILPELEFSLIGKV